MKKIERLEVKSVQYVHNPDAMREWVRLYVKALLDKAIENHRQQPD